mmetsp:Transcript_118137/g.338898  ORF Transcript_118137/g.338898 Transcript_118137/m.338898 type:complete len:227 (+) Transcript_118137:172-852(+)
MRVRSTRSAGSSPSQNWRSTVSDSSGVSSRTVARFGWTSPCTKTQTFSRSSKRSRLISRTRPMALANTEYAFADLRSHAKSRRLTPALFLQSVNVSMGTISSTFSRSSLSSCAAAWKARTFTLSSSVSSNGFDGELTIALGLSGALNGKLAFRVGASPESESRRSRPSPSSSAASGAAPGCPGLRKLPGLLLSRAPVICSGEETAEEKEDGLSGSGDENCRACRFG